MAKRLKLKTYREPITQVIPHRLYAFPSQSVAIREQPFLTAKILGSLEKGIEVECETETKEQDGYTHAELKGHRGWFVIRHGNKKYCITRKEYDAVPLDK
mgnify:CR=1 FL=1